MGKGEDGPEEDKTDNELNNNSKPTNESASKSEENTKKNTDELRKVIRVGSPEEKKEAPKQSDSRDSEEISRENLEQRRAILQSIKDFDFQIKKNSEEITTINKKLDSVTKDLDDLVSLYEIVSEQMNPFVGLSKVTKKRIEALENFTKDIEELKNRMNDIEAFAENTGINLHGLLDGTNLRKGSKDNTEDLSTDDMDIIIEKTLSEVTVDERIDAVINEFLDGLNEKEEN